MGKEERDREKGEGRLKREMKAIERKEKREMYRVCWNGRRKYVCIFNELK